MTKSKYTDKHFEKVAKLYRKYGTASLVQDHFPDSSVRTVQRWVRVCYDRGLL